MAGKEQASTANNKATVIAVILVIIICIGTYFIMQSQAEDKPDTGDNTGAYVVCKDFVTDRLKAPSTAEFPSMYYSTIEKLTDTTWRVKSYVDAQNSFGAMIRTNFICEVRYTGNNNWRLVDLTTD